MSDIQTIKLPNSADYHDLYQLSGFTMGESLIVVNNTGGQIRLHQSTEAPTERLIGYPIWPNNTALAHGNDDLPVWCKGGTDGYVIVQKVTSTVLPFTGVEFAQDIVTSGKQGFRRLQVDQGQTGFFEGRNFRLIRKIRNEFVLKFESPVDFILYEQVFGVTSGNYEFHAWRTNNVEETAAFTDDLTQYVVNQNGSAEFRDYNGGRYQSQVTLTTGGAIAVADVEQYTDYAEMKTSNSTAQRSSVSQSGNTQRYLPAGTYYLEFTFIDTPVRGVYQIGWEERPAGVK